MISLMAIASQLSRQREKMDRFSYLPLHTHLLPQKEDKRIQPQIAVLRVIWSKTKATWRKQVDTANFGVEPRSPGRCRSVRAKVVFSAGIVTALCACTQVNYTAYVGQQQDWPFATGATVQRDFALPVYQGPPDRPYRVLGWVQVENARGRLWRRAGGIRVAVKEAAERGADAVILLRNRGTGGNIPGKGQARVIAIKFL